MKRLLIIVVLLLGASATSVFGQIPDSLSFQGVLVDTTTGFPLNGPQNLDFRIYDAPIGGALLWNESHPATPVGRGLYSVILGSAGSPLTILFDKAYWLEMDLNGSTMTPRVPLTAGAYSFSSKSLFGTANVVPSSGSVGFGTNAPATNVHVVGSAPVTRVQSTQTTGGASSYLQIGRTNAGSFFQTGSVGLPGSGDYLEIASPQFIDFVASFASKMRISSGGVAVGDPLPGANAALTVNGALSLQDAAPPLATGGFGKIYVSSGSLFYIDGGGATTDLTAAGIGGGGAGGQATFWTGPSTLAGDNNFFWDNTNKRLGIKTTTPGAGLTVSGAAIYESAIGIVNTGGGTEWRIASRTTGNLDFIKIPGGTFTAMSIDDLTGNVGINTTAPSAKLDVVGTFQLQDGTQGTNRFLKSDASGNASWDYALTPTKSGFAGSIVTIVNNGLTTYLSTPALTITPAVSGTVNLYVQTRYNFDLGVASQALIGVNINTTGVLPPSTTGLTTGVLAGWAVPPAGAGFGDIPVSFTYPLVVTGGVTYYIWMGATDINFAQTSGTFSSTRVTATLHTTSGL